MLELEVKLELALLAATIYNRGRDMKMVVGQIPIRFPSQRYFAFNIVIKHIKCKCIISSFPRPTPNDVRFTFIAQLINSVSTWYQYWLLKSKSLLSLDIIISIV